MSDDRAELARIEDAMRDLAPTSDTWWSLRSKRNALRDTIDIRWRAEHGYGTRRDRSRLSSWPSAVKARWRILRAHIEEWNAVRTGDVGRTCERLARVEKLNGKCGASLREWIVLVDDILRDDGWGHLLRDAVSFQRVDGTERFSILIQGEGDYHWTIAKAEMKKADPPVKGYWLDEESGRWRPDSSKRKPPYGSFPHITDFVRNMLETYGDDLQPHPRLSHELTPTRPPPDMATEPPGRD